MSKIILRDTSTLENAKRNKASRFDVFEGIGSPEGFVLGKKADIYIRLDGDEGETIYFKERYPDSVSGWAARGAGGGSGWQWEQNIAVTESASSFQLENDIDENDKIIVQRNGLELSFGEEDDYTFDYEQDLLVMNYIITEGSKLKIRKW